MALCFLSTWNQPMPTPLFEPGNKLAKGGKRPGAGRPSKKQLASLEIKREQIKQRLAEDADGIYGDWRQWIKESATAANHAIDKILGDEKTEAQRAISINFVQYNNTVQLRAEGVPAPVLAGNGEQKASGISVAPASWQRQNGAELHDIEDVS